MTHLRQHATKGTPQSEKARERQKPNSAGGFSFAVDRWARLRRFLVLGSEGGTYYAGEYDLTKQNVGVVKECIAEDGPRTVTEIVTISTEGRAPKNDTAIFALASCVAFGDEATKRIALDRMHEVCRIGTHLFTFVGFLEGFKCLTGRAKRRALAEWYTSKDIERVAYQIIKYRQRNGWSHRDVLRIAHPAKRVSAGNPTTEVSDQHAALFNWIVKGQEHPKVPIVEGFVQAQEAKTPKASAKLIREYGLPREAILTEHLNKAEVWEALLEDMPVTAMIRNLANMTRAGVLTPGSDGTKQVLTVLQDEDRLRKARLHPISILVAMDTYAAGHGFRGTNTWNPVTKIVDELDSAFYRSFGFVEPTGKRILIGLDVSGSMGWPALAGTQNISPRVGAAAMCLVTANVEDDYEIMGFTHGFVPLTISPKQRLDDVVKYTSQLGFDGTDCSLPMIYAMDNDRKVDTFIVYTDSETWAGRMHPHEALEQYRQKSGIDAQLVVVGMVANEFSIADPNDAGMLDVVGFDTATPQLISDFSAGRI